MTSPSNEKLVLGLWDGHDAGAALLRGNEIISAVNEERFTRRKLEVGFPHLSIKTALDQAGVTGSDLDHVAWTTSDFSKTLTRVLPHLKEEYYLIRRRKKAPGRFTSLKKLSKYKLTEIPPSLVTRVVSKRVLTRELKPYGIDQDKLCLVDHHTAHAAGAALCSGFDSCLVLTIDGIGDALSGSIWSWTDGELKPLAKLPGNRSLGIFFEHVTNLLNMRELEDEGKVMALANYAHPIPDTENPLLGLFQVSGLTLESRFGSLGLYRELKRLLWFYPSEQFAYMAQRALEVWTQSLVREACARTEHDRVAYAGGVASNVKVNMLLRHLPQVHELFVFPHMGDGGLALGAALWCSNQQVGGKTFDLRDLMLGPTHSPEEFPSIVANVPALRISKLENPTSIAAKLISEGQLVLWFYGGMEYGPRALGGRSVLALPNSRAIRDDLNLSLKKRVWYQPFCPTMLRSEALRVLKDYQGEKADQMTCAYEVRPEHVETMAGVISVDGTCRPQILDDQREHPFIPVLLELKRLTGTGIMLNTSFNLHGEPLVCTPEDAISTLTRTDFRFLLADRFLIEKS